mmetsp:Transcript_81537/g.243053  ORF Transcript_81537/g.243053 Transcript_81537/m.243053 type:complete len:268 (-) Transcript_81537:48-851(-)
MRRLAAVAVAYVHSAKAAALEFLRLHVLPGLLAIPHAVLVWKRGGDLCVRVKPAAAAPASHLPGVLVRLDELEQRLLVDDAVGPHRQGTSIDTVHERELASVGGYEDVHALALSHVEAVPWLCQLMDQLATIRELGLKICDPPKCCHLRLGVWGAHALCFVRLGKASDSARLVAIFPRACCAGRRDWNAKPQLGDHLRVTLCNPISHAVLGKALLVQLLDRQLDLAFVHLQPGRWHDAVTRAAEAAHRCKHAHPGAREHGHAPSRGH